MCIRNVEKNPFRGTKILFYGRGLKFLSPLIGTNSKLVRPSHIEQSVIYDSNTAVTQVLTLAVLSLGKSTRPFPPFAEQEQTTT